MRNKLQLLFVLLSPFLYSQSQTSYEYEKISNMTNPPSEEAYKLGTFGSLPVGLITGTPNISIPLTSANLGQIEIPFSLNYSTTGLRVNELEGYVGLGWQLIGGGVITRTVQDMPDEDGNYHFPDFNIKQKLEQGNLQAYQFVNHIQDQAVDSEPDIYNFQFLGRSGRFIFDSQQNIIQLDQSNLKIERKGEPIVGYYYEIKDEIGTIYEFKETEISFTSKSSQGAPAPSKVSSWFLSKITEAKTKQIITLVYEDNDYSYTNAAQQSLSFFAPLFFQGFGQGAYSGLPLATISNEVSSVNILKSKILKEIIVPNHLKILFNYSQHIIRAPKILDNIIVKDPNNNLVDNIEFIYTTTPNNRVFLNEVINTFKNQKHSFEYDNPNAFPARLSRSQDLYGYYNGITTNTTLIPNFYASLHSFYIGEKYNSLAERKPNILFNKIGLLKRVTYPTKGYSEINYEGNDERQETLDKQVYVRPSQLFSLGHLTYLRDSEDNVPTTSTTINNPWQYNLTTAKKIYFQTFTEKYYNCPYGDSLPPNGFRATLRILKDGVQFDQISINTTQVVTEKLLAPGSYSFYIDSVINSCTAVWVNIGDQALVPAHYELIPQKTITTSIGSRVASIVDKDSYGVEKDSKHYRYYEFFNLYPLEFRSFTANFFLVNYTPFINTSIVINTNDQNIFPTSSPNYLYRKVDVSHGGSNFQKGGETHFFNIAPHYESSLILGFENNDRKIHSYTSWINTKESETIYFDSSKNPIKKINYNYGERGSFNKSYFGIIAHESFARYTGIIEQNSTVVACSGTNDPIELISYPHCYNQPAGTLVGSLAALYNVEMIQYEIDSFNKFLQSQVTTDYLNGIQLQTTTEYYYNNPAHYQLTDQKTIFPDDSSQLTSYKYANEKGKTKLIEANMVGMPLETTVVKKQSINDPGTVIAKSETLYPDVIPDTQTGDLLLPKSASSLDLLTGGMATDVTYNQYDSKGNLQQYTTKSGVSTAIVWGYNNTQPIAKIEGATYAQVSSLASAIISASDTDASAGVNNDESSFLAVMKTFRESLPNYQVTTYTYDPLVGVRSITPPNGIKQIYIYDNANRLKEIRENSQTGNLLKEYEYNYKH
ncbi:MAG: hypothetical protein DI529_14140 [Chryseobacterium sp.]|nr:MAG: hypothetical protein DI529_14140 [Chryseobacterium sp.]